MPGFPKDALVQKAKGAFKCPKTLPAGVTQQMCLDYLVGVSGAITEAVGIWKVTASLTEVKINACIASGGKVQGPGMEHLISTRAPRNTPWSINLSNAVSRGIHNCWKDWERSLSVPNLPWYPVFAAYPGANTPPVPNIPSPLAAMRQSLDCFKPSTLLTQMKAKLNGSPAAGPEILAALAEGVSTAFFVWIPTQMITEVIGQGTAPLIWGFGSSVLPSQVVDGRAQGVAPFKT
jgi:hypothetical protein